MKRFLILPALVALFCCGNSQWKISELESPAAGKSGEPFLVSDETGILMSWIQEESEGNHALKWARWDGGMWSSAQTIRSKVPFFVNWADFPSIMPLSKESMAAHWLEKRGQGSYSYHVMISASSDGGKTWSEPSAPHSDTSENEHGFASLVDLGNGEFSAAWLDGRMFHAGTPHSPADEMALMYSKIGTHQEATLDSRVCDCCQTTAVRTPDGIFVAYRDRSEKEIRDISYVRFSSGKWSDPQTLYPDGWQIAGCPVNGPAADAKDRIIVVAWYTGAGGQGKVQVVFSPDAGASFGKPVQVDGGNPSGRVDVVLLNDGSALVSWLENIKDKGAEIRVRQVFQDGRIAQALTVADTSNARASGFPRMAGFRGDVYIAWTYMSGPARIRVARIEM